MSARNTHTHIYTHTHTHLYIYTHTQVQGMMTAEVNLPMLMSLLWMGLLPSGLALALETVIVHKLPRSYVLCVCACVCAVRLYVFLCQREGVRVCVCVCLCASINTSAYVYTGTYFCMYLRIHILMYFYT